MTSNDFHFYYSYTLTTQIDFCYIDAIFQSIDLHVNECINKQLLVDYNLLNKAFWSSALGK